ncbi:two-component system chemotaxis sensor kinase CheA [Ancylobacter aquaticus]|uniref:Chemotaxis protein CheA n=1 Tax=Ancylobacter aquaticus TaxID=100 RepID=A0A4R1HQZ1_ANCAQ|nr:chemotaxis protein CheA [Ancylobacter aquaticus]TCK19772.1 two-component system chemotaxis sensor kinase CheA [Ancylobacter aquaticus]
MNEFIEQFLIEARELVEQGTADLLAAEERPKDAAAIDGAFRAFHTLKGSAGIIDFAAMARALHVAEDSLSEARGGSLPITNELISHCLSCLDQVVQWLEVIEQTGEPPADADSGADAVVALFEPGAPTPAKASPEVAANLDAWLDALSVAKPDVRAAARSALCHQPDEGSFFRGDDPLVRIRDLSGLLAVDLVPTGPAVPPAEIDPFACHLLIFAISSEQVSSLAPAFADVAGQFEWRELAGPVVATLSPAAQLIEAQIALLQGPQGEGFDGRKAAALNTAINVRRAEGRDADARHIEHLAASDAGVEALVDTLRSGAAAPADNAAEEARASEPSAQDLAARSLRVNVERIDALVRLTGELTVLKHAIGHAAAMADRGDTESLGTMLKAQYGSLDRLVSELQHAVLNIRVLPLRHVFQRFPRLVRDMSDKLGKPMRLVIEGEETEADKTIVEALFEPLLHVLRNAADHGIEVPGARAEAGKPPTGVVILRARRDGDHLAVEVEDDGRGIDTARVRSVATERGVASAAAIAAMSEEAAADLIFAPGFSTRSEVTGYSGRGVGMDAVRVAVQRLGGRVSLHSRPEHGSLVRMTLPFTIMKTDVMTVEAGGQVLGIPLDTVIETARIPRAAISNIGAAQAFTWRNRTVPLLDLSSAIDASTASTSSADALVVIVTIAGEYCGLEVERLGERMDVMLRPMEGLLAGLPCAGTTLLGDGRVLLVLDLHELQL